MAKIIPATREHMPVRVEHECMRFTKRYLLDRLRVEDVFGYLLREGANLSHVVILKVGLGQA